MDSLTLPAMNSGFVLQKSGKIILITGLIFMIFVTMQPVVVKSQLYRIFRGVYKAQMLWQTRGWEEVQGPHFIVRYRHQDYQNAQMVMETAEKSYGPVSKNFAGAYHGKVLVVIYPTKESLGRSFGWAADESAMGVYWAGVIRVLSPQVWITENDPERVRQIFEKEGPLAHEYAHLLVDYDTGGNYTRWFTEGIAQYIEAKVTGYRMDHGEVRQRDEFYDLSRMDKDFDSLGDQSLAYYESLQAVNYLVSRYGEDSLSSILNKLGSGQSMETSFRSVLGVSLWEFERDFKLWAIENS